MKAIVTNSDGAVQVFNRIARALGVKQYSCNNAPSAAIKITSELIEEHANHPELFAKFIGKTCQVVGELDAFGDFWGKESDSISYENACITDSNGNTLYNETYWHIV